MSKHNRAYNEGFNAARNNPNAQNPYDDDLNEVQWDRGFEAFMQQNRRQARRAKHSFDIDTEE